MQNELKTGAGCGLIVAAILAALLVIPLAAGVILDAAGERQAAAIRATADLAMARSVARQLDAGTAAVIADTAAAHNVARQMAASGVTVALGGGLVVAVVMIVAVGYDAQRRQIAALTAIVAELTAERRGSGGGER